MDTSKKVFDFYVDFATIYDGSQYAWSENTGWLNFDPTANPGVVVTSDKVIGYVWGENIGWINFGIADNYVIVCKMTLADLFNFASDWFEAGIGIAGDLIGDEAVD